METVLSGVKKIHLIGIGGIGMTGLALLLKEKGYDISGSDTQDSYNVALLRKEGITVDVGHSSSHINKDIDLVSFSSAVREDNSEFLEALKRGIRVIKRGALLGLLTKGVKTVAVAGSHGKTTTTSLIGFLLSSLGKQPTVCVGGLPLNYQRNAWWGEGYFVVETDESDASFLYINPTVSIITNIDHEHLDYYKTVEELRKSFLQFAKQTSDLVIGCGDDTCVREIIQEVKGVSYGFGPENHVCARNVHFDGTHTCFDVVTLEAQYPGIKIPLLGEHNVRNALGVITFLSYLNEDIEAIKELLKNFKGTKRRFQIKKQCAGVTFVDDYAHHPTEISAVLSAARCLKPKRLLVIFQPHRYSRVQNLYREFARCFHNADLLVVTDIYSASEKGIEGINAAFMLDEIKKNFKGHVHYTPKDFLVKDITSMLTQGDLVIGLGAGDINNIMERIIDEFEKTRCKTQR